MTRIMRPQPDGSLLPEQLSALAEAARGCKIIAFPTDTVYGLGSTGLVKAAARRIYQLKERPSLKPLPVLVHSIEAAKIWAEWTPAAEQLARRFWPGALTLVLRPTEKGRLLTFAEYQTVAFRVPALPLLRKMIEASGVPWASTSANRSGEPALTDGAAVVAAFDGRVEFIVDAGRAPGVESTLVDATAPPARVLREGAIKADAVHEALGQRV